MASLPVLTMWTVYDHPSDFPDCFVARKWEIHAGEPRATDEVMTEPELIQLRERIVLETGCTDKIERSPHDDPKILEVWL